MAKGFTDSIGEVNVAPFVKQPVIDQSAGYGSASDINAFTNAAKLSTAVYKDVAELNALQGITGEIRDEIDAYETTSPSKILERQEGLQKSETELAKLPSKEGGTPEQVNSAINNILSDIDTQKSYLTKAQSQDRISGFEFDQRVKQILKDKITQYPYLKSEILSHGKTILDLEGIENRIKLDDKMATSKAGMDDWLWKEIYKEAKDNSINLNSPIYRLPNGDIDIQALDAVNQYYRNGKFGDKMLEEAAKRNENIDKLTLNRAIKNGDLDAITISRQKDNINAIESYFTVLDANGQVRENLSADEFANSKAKAKKYINDEITRAEITFSVYGLQNPEVDKRLTRYKDRLTDALTAIEGYKNYSDVKTFVETQKNIVEANVQLNLRDKFGAAEEILTFLEKIVTVGPTFRVNFQDAKYTEFVENVNKMITPIAGEGSSQLAELLNQNPINKNESMIQSSVKLGLTKLSTDSRGLEFANKLMSEIDKGLSDNNATDAEKYKLYTETILGLSNNNVTSDDIRSLDQRHINTLVTSIDNTLPILYSNMQREASDKGIEILTDGQGLLVAKGGDQQFNNKYLIPINNSVKVYGKLMALENNKEVIKNLTTKPVVEPTQIEQSVETTPTEEVITAPVEPETPIKETTAKEFDLDFVVNELGPVESKEGHRDKAGKLIKSSKGALGQFQILPSTAKDPGFGLPSIDLETSTVMEQAQWVQNYLDKLVSYYRGDKEKALAAYNYGLGNVDKLIEANGNKWKTKLPSETVNYLDSLL